MLLALLTLACADKAADSAAPDDPLEPALVFDGERPTNLLIISIDTLRRDHVGRWGGRDLTPALDHWLGQGFVLADHRSCANWTWPSMLCALSGQDLVQLGVVTPGPSDDPPPLPAAAPWLAQQLSDAGYATGLVSGNKFMGPEYGTDRGFDVVHDKPEEGLPAADLVAAAEATLHALRAGGAPWYLHLHFMDPHDPYSPPLEYLAGEVDPSPVEGVELDLRNGVRQAWSRWGEFTAEEQQAIMDNVGLLYDGDVRYTDDYVGQVLTAMELVGALDDTLVVFFSDHGEQFWDHGRYYHRQDLHDEEVAAVAGFWARGLRPGETALPTTHLDLAPTVLRALGLPPLEAPGGAVVGAFDADRPRFAHSVNNDKTWQSVDLEGRRLLARWDGDREYYLLDRDPLEQDDRYEVSDPQVIALEALLAPEIAALQALVEAAEAAEGGGGG